MFQITRCFSLNKITVSLVIYVDAQLVIRRICEKKEIFISLSPSRSLNLSFFRISCFSFLFLTSCLFSFNTLLLIFLFVLNFNLLSKCFLSLYNALFHPILFFVSFSFALFLLSSLLCYFFCSLLLSLSVCIYCFKFPSFLLHFFSLFSFSIWSLLITVSFTFFLSFFFPQVFFLVYFLYRVLSVCL